MSEHDRRNDWSVFAAIALIVAGVWLLFGRLDAPWFDALRNAVRFVFTLAWPLALIALGILILVAAKRGGLGRIDVRGKRLYRSRTDRMIGGVLAGLGEYLGVDPTWLRIGYVVLGVLTGFGPAVVIYIIAMIVVPEAPVAAPEQPVWPQPQTPGRETVQTPPPAPEPPPVPRSPEQG